MDHIQRPRHTLGCGPLVLPSLHLPRHPSLLASLPLGLGSWLAHPQANPLASRRSHRQSRMAHPHPNPLA